MSLRCGPSVDVRDFISDADVDVETAVRAVGAVCGSTAPGNKSDCSREVDDGDVTSCLDGGCDIRPTADTAADSGTDTLDKLVVACSTGDGDCNEVNGSEFDSELDELVAVADLEIVDDSGTDDSARVKVGNDDAVVAARACGSSDRDSELLEDVVAETEEVCVSDGAEVAGGGGDDADAGVDRKAERRLEVV